MVQSDQMPPSCTLRPAADGRSFHPLLLLAPFFKHLGQLKVQHCPSFLTAARMLTPLSFFWAGRVEREL